VQLIVTAEVGNRFAKRCDEREIELIEYRLKLCDRDDAHRLFYLREIKYYYYLKDLEMFGCMLDTLSLLLKFLISRSTYFPILLKAYSCDRLVYKVISCSVKREIYLRK